MTACFLSQFWGLEAWITVPARRVLRVPFTWSQARTEACVPGSVPSPGSSLLFQPQQEEAGTRSARPVPLALPAQAP